MASRLDDLIEMLKPNMLFITFLGVLLGLVVLILGTASSFFPDAVADSDFFDAIENVNIVLFIVGLLALVICGFYFYDYYTSLKEFDELLQTHSRAKFVRNQGELERLALKLGSKKEKEYFQAKSRLKIK